MDESDGSEAAVDEGPQDDVSRTPNDNADPEDVVNRLIPPDIRARYEVYSYRNAAVILSQTRTAEFDEILAALRSFFITTEEIRRPGGNESDIPKRFTASLRPKGWYETIIQGDLVVRLAYKKQVGTRNEKPIFEKVVTEKIRERYLDGHKIDYVKDRVAFDLEWNSKDQTFDRDLYAFSAFALCGVIDAAVLLTRSEELNRVFAGLGQALNKRGEPDVDADGRAKMIVSKYGASTTWMGKLLYRLNAGRNGGCPVLALGIKSSCVRGWPQND